MKYFALSLALIVHPALAKDQSGLPATTEPPEVVYSIEVCAQKQTTKTKKKRTTVHLHRKDCTFYPAGSRPVYLLSWSNIFREIQRARECGVPLFRGYECAG